MHYLIVIFILANCTLAHSSEDPREERYKQRQRVKDEAEARKKRDELIAGLRIRIPEIPKTEEERMVKKISRRRPRKTQPSITVPSKPDCHVANTCFCIGIVTLMGFLYLSPRLITLTP